MSPSDRAGNLAHLIADKWIAEHVTMGSPATVSVSVARSKCMLTGSRLTLWNPIELAP